MANYNVSDSSLISIANAIRAKGGTNLPLEYPDDFVTAIQNISSSGGGSALIVDTSDQAGGIIRTITTTDEVYIQESKTVTPTSSQQTILPDEGYDALGQVVVEAASGGAANLTTKTVTPSDEIQVIDGNNYLCKGIFYQIHVAQDRTASNTMVGTSYNFTPRTTLTLNTEYAVIGRINVVDSNDDILEYYDVDTTIIWNNSYSSTTSLIVDNSSNPNAYYKQIALTRNTGSYDFYLYTMYQKTAKYGIAFNLNIYEITEYDGLSRVTVNPVPDTYYSPDLIKKMIQRDMSFTTFNFPDGITKIGTHAFDNCQYLALASLPSSITLINTYAFYNCSNLALTNLPSGLTSIATYAFYGCKNLALTSLPSGITSIGQYTFSGCTSLALTSLPSGITSIGSYAFQGCTSLALTSLPSGITNIATYTFSGCTSLALTSLPSGITSINGNAFKNCTGLTTIYCNGVISTFSAGSFNGDSTNHMQLTSARFPNMALSSNISTVFGFSTAENACQELEICDIGITTGIASNAFANCYKLQTLILRKTSVCTLANTSAFTNTPLSGYNGLTATVYVPSSLISSYQAASNWSTLYNAGNVTFSAIEGSQYELN